ncbi:MAG: hypothetical protein V4463_17825 [Pseudomonadota bacterium]
MRPTVLEPVPLSAPAAEAQRRHHRREEDALLLTQLDPASIFDVPAGNSAPCELITFGNVRETCPACQSVQLKLVLRQTNVRMAHLFCPQCNCCYDARYANGSSALTI